MIIWKRNHEKDYYQQLNLGIFRGVEGTIIFDNPVPIGTTIILIPLKPEPLSSRSSN